MRILLLTAIIFVLFCTALHSYANDSTSLVDRLTGFPSKFLNRINKKTADLDKQLTEQAAKYVRQLQKKENRLRKKLSRSDSTSAQALFSGDPTQRYASLLKKLQSDSTTIARPASGAYLPYIDSLKESLEFFNKNPQLLSSSQIVHSDIQHSLSQLALLQSKMQTADQLQQFIQQRKDQFKRYLSRLTTMPGGVTNCYNSYNKQLYYYSAQINAYKETLNDPDKLLKTALGILNKLPVFTSFMQRNSMLAGLLNIPSGTGPAGANVNATALTGMQTRDQVMNSIQNQFGAGMPNLNGIVQQNMQSATGEIDQLRNKLNAFGTSGGDIDIPNFKPNAQKTKSFLKRIEVGTNMQTAHSSTFYPTTTDLGLSVGYRITDKNVVGIGGSYKIGWGSDIKHIQFSSQGASLRSFLDIQLKKSFFASGGFEYNYQKPFYSFADIQHFSNWQQSGLVGISKIVSMNTKVLKKAKLQLLWDFLSYQQLPKTQPIKFRVGYSF